ncbi:MAG: class I SAM-dependent methyltransferase [Deltaproteobacteria bacterium]|nr:class I SAM-dependent methyltransferase [Deltaproteobacteria bacterium]
MLAETVRADFDRIAAAEPPDHVEAPARRLVETLGMRTRVLEIGCGTGALARMMARRGARVTAIDLAPGMIDLARGRTPGHLAIDYRVGDLRRLSPRGFDVAIAVNTLHHLPLAEGLARMASAVAPGGRVLVVDLFEARGIAELPYNAISWLLRTRETIAHELAAAWAAHRDDALPSLAEIRRVAERALPGAMVRRHLGWRYSLRWNKPHV